MNDYLELRTKKTNFIINDSVGSRKMKRFRKYHVEKSTFGEPIIVADLSEIEREIEYDPFNNTSELLQDFILAMRKNSDLLKLETSTMTEKQLLLFADQLLPFVDKFGLFGTYRQQIGKIFQDANGQIKVKIKGNANDESIDYYAYVKRYIHKIPYNKQTLNFDSTVKDIFIGDNVNELHCILKEFSSLLELWTAFSNGNHELNDRVGFSELEILKDKNDYFWEDILRLETQISYIGIGIDFVNGEKKIVWNFSTLFEAIKIIYINNLVFEDSRIKICKLKTCGKPFISSAPTQICCDHFCNDALRQQRVRDIEIVGKYFARGLSDEEIAIKMNIGISYVSECLKKKIEKDKMRAKKEEQKTDGKL